MMNVRSQCLATISTFLPILSDLTSKPIQVQFEYETLSNNDKMMSKASFVADFRTLLLQSLNPSSPGISAFCGE
jgi:hypothetical protein